MCVSREEKTCLSPGLEKVGGKVTPEEVDLILVLLLTVRERSFASLRDSEGIRRWKSVSTVSGRTEMVASTERQELRRLTQWESCGMAEKREGELIVSDSAVWTMSELPLRMVLSEDFRRSSTLIADFCVLGLPLTTSTWPPVRILETSECARLKVKDLGSNSNTPVLE